MHARSAVGSIHQGEETLGTPRGKAVKWEQVAKIEAKPRRCSYTAIWQHLPMIMGKGTFSLHLPPSIYMMIQLCAAIANHPPSFFCVALER